MKAAIKYQYTTANNSIVEEQFKPFSISERCFLFSQSVLSFISKAEYSRIYFSLYDQLLRSATSVGANVTEGKAGSSKKDWIKFMTIALKSANETVYWLRLIGQLKTEDKNEIDLLISESTALSKIIASIIINAQKNIN